ncbi:MAG: WXG100 family type VII secretion target [Mycobacterium sp.]|nr:WXG100 family type VII secretion target [Mycobacterium sp.]
MGKMHVTPEVLRQTKAEMENYIVEANGLVEGYLNTHQDAMGAIWNGPAGTASMTTAQHLRSELIQTTDGLQGMAHGLGNAANLVEHHEEEQARAMSSFAGS